MQEGRWLFLPTCPESSESQRKGTLCTHDPAMRSAVVFTLLASASAFMPLAPRRPTVATLAASPRLAVSVHMVDDPAAKAAAAAKVKAAVDAKKKAAAEKKEAPEGDAGEEEEDPVAKAAAEKKAAEEEAAKKAAEEAAKKQKAAEAKAKADAKAAAEKAEAVACFSDQNLVLTMRAGAPPASVNERADFLRAKGIPEAAVKAALKELGQEEIPYERDYFGNIIFPSIINGKPVYKAGRGGL